MKQEKGGEKMNNNLKELMRKINMAYVDKLGREGLTLQQSRDAASIVYQSLNNMVVNNDDVRMFRKEHQKIIQI